MDTIDTTPGATIYVQNDTDTISCEEAAGYYSRTFTLTFPNTTRTLYLSERNTTITFSSSTTGNTTWLYNDSNNKCCSEPLNSTNGYNNTTGIYTIATSRFQENDKISIRFNAKNSSGSSGNDLAQYYEWINKPETGITDKIGILPDIDSTVWIKTYDYGNRNLFDTTIRFTVYPDNNYSNGYVVTQRVTRPLTGEAAPGTPIYIKSDYTYWISATKEGYICETIAPWIGKDFESNNPLEIRCRVSGATSEYDYVIIGPLQYTDETLR